MEGFLSLLIPVICLLIAFTWGIIIGLKRVRIRFICVALSFVVALIVAFVAKDIQYAEIERWFGSSLQTANQPVSDIWKFIQESEPLQEVLTASGGAIISPAMFCGVFVGLSVASGIICYLVFIITGIVNLVLKKKRKRAPLRILLYTALQVVLTVFVYMTVAVSYMDCLPPVVDAVAKVGVLPEQSDYVDEMNVDKMRSMLDTANGAPLTVIYRTLGGNGFCRALTSFEVNGEKTSLYDELHSISDFAADLYLLSDCDIQKYGDREVQAMKSLGQDFEKSQLLPTIAGEVIYGATDAWLTEDGSFIGVKKPVLDDMTADAFGEMFDHILVILRDDARVKTSLCADFETLSNILRIIVEDEVLTEFSTGNSEAVVKKLSSGSTVQRLIAEMEQNDSFHILINDVTMIGMRAVGSMLQLPEYDAEVFEQFTDDIAGAINQVRDPNMPVEEQKALLTGEIRNALDTSGTDIEVDDSVLELYADALLNEFEGKDTITADDVAHLFSEITGDQAV